MRIYFEPQPTLGNAQQRASSSDTGRTQMSSDPTVEPIFISVVPITRSQTPDQ